MNSNIPIIFDTSDGQQLRINMIGSWLKRHFGRKMVKLSIDGGFTCPNRDGTKGFGGCLFCSDSGSGDMASPIGTGGLLKNEGTESAYGLQEPASAANHKPADFTGTINQKPAVPAGTINQKPADPANAVKHEPEESASAVGGDQIRTALDDQIRLLSDKWPQAGYIAYFQNHTNTYAPAAQLRELFEAALEQPDVIGLAIATRPDCISDEVLDLLEELNRKTFLWVELGLQTIHDETARAMNLCHSLADYDNAVVRLHERGIRIVTHLILGLPGESRRMMLDSVRYVCQPLHSPAASSGPYSSRPASDLPVKPASYLFGLKLHMLNVVRSSALPLEYPGFVPFESIDDYTDFVIEALELVPPDITIQRISGDAPRRDLIAPEWSFRKRTILNTIHRKMRERDTWQGKMSRNDHP